MEVTSTITGVTKKLVTPKNGSPPFDLFEIEDGTGVKWTTKKKDLALTAHALVGRSVLITGDVKQNGNYTNYYLTAIKEATRDELIASATGTRTLENTTFLDPPTRAAVADNEREEKIFRQVATKVAATMSDTSDDFWTNVRVLLDFYRTGNFPEYATAGASYGHDTYTSSTDDDIDDIPF